MILAGRGFGKTRTAVEWLHDRADSGAMRDGGIMVRTNGDLFKTAIHGRSGLVTLSRPHNPCRFIDGTKKVVLWENGAKALCFTAEEPDGARGPEFDTLWFDELAAYNRLPTPVDMMRFGFRITDGHGKPGQAVITTTPRNVKIIKEFLDDKLKCFPVRGSTYDNIDNLDPEFIADLEKKYDGTRLGRQELYGEVLTDVEGALWTGEMIQAALDKYDSEPQARKCVRILVAVDPAITHGADSDETGIIVVGETVMGGYIVLEDLTCRLSPNGWATVAVGAYHRWKANGVVAESNQGGDMVESTIKTVDARVVVKLVHASHAKRARAEPVAALYEQGKVAHAPGLTKLEDQLTSFTGTRGEESPDRHDALVWGISELLDKQPPKRKFILI